MTVVSKPLTAKQTFIELLDNAGDWFVRVVEDGRETVRTFDKRSSAKACAEGHRTRLGLEEVTRV
ncbi:hypothetical protein SAZ10_33155 [Mesorhizobium sp. BAC0120]|uniref:hypothetical protein n=1 Tax=Mesorhizobium sp. BAC0120 TaxID=3090670 RepID=UPI00298CFFCF|nr:hypothetical protein [Mesorhizobium sp. BAC0120]MDW6026621.1 hypothetical protein [Mesorhizobium sp. BAC0120]